MLDFIPAPDLGYERDKFLSKVTRVVGKGNWFWAFSIEKKFYSWQWGLQLYEDAFWEHFKKNLPALKDLIDKYCDVFVINRFDMEAGSDYKKQTQSKDHYSDIAVRRCLIRFGLTFKGKDLLDISETPYYDKMIPFHLPHLIRKPDKIASAKSWLSSNRWIVVAPEVEDQAKFSEILIK